MHLSHILTIAIGAKPPGSKAERLMLPPSVFRQAKIVLFLCSNIYARWAGKLIRFKVQGPRFKVENSKGSADHV